MAANRTSVSKLIEFPKTAFLSASASLREKIRESIHAYTDDRHQRPGGDGH